MNKRGDRWPPWSTPDVLRKIIVFFSKINFWNLRYFQIITVATGPDELDNPHIPTTV